MKLGVAKKNLEFSVGVPSIIKKYILNYNGKYIVFCRDTDHLEEAVCLVNSWFRESGYEGNINNYKVGVNYSDSDERLEEFRNNDKVGLHLLFAIEKLNEGVHIPSVDGVILLRPTSSNIIYYQQIGRCITANSDKQPIIFDLVDNANGVKVVLKDDIKKCVDIRIDNGYADCSSNFDIEKYTIIDCLYETVELFREIEDNIVLKYKEWTKDEDNVLINHYTTDGIDFCMSKLLNRTRNACYYRATELKLINRTRKQWTIEEDNILIDNYVSKGVDFCMMKLPTRTRQSITARAKILHLSYKQNAWTDDDIEILKRYCKHDIKTLIEKIPNHTEKEIKNKMSKLNIYTSNRWTDEEKKIVIEKYPIMGDECVVYLPHRTKQAIRSFANSNGVFKKTYIENKKTSKYKYVYWSKQRNKWRVAFSIGYKKYSFGEYNDEDEAGKVALEKAKEYGKI